MNLPERHGDQRRIGVAIEVPDPYGRELQEARQRFGDPLAEAIPPHITLLGPTVLEPEEVPPAIEHLRRVARVNRPFPVLLRGTGTFRPVSAVVFIQVAAGIAECEQLERQVRSGPLEQDLRFSYHPHVTVAHDVPPAALDQAFEELAHYTAEFQVTEFLLYEHGDDGVWRPHEAFVLGG